MEELEKDKNEWKNNTVLTLLSRLGEKKFLKIKNSASNKSRIPDHADPQLS